MLGPTMHQIRYVALTADPTRRVVLHPQIPVRREDVLCSQMRRLAVANENLTRRIGSLEEQLREQSEQVKALQAAAQCQEQLKEQSEQLKTMVASLAEINAKMNEWDEWHAAPEDEDVDIDIPQLDIDIPQAHWDQFSENCRFFGVRSSYDDTTPLDPSQLTEELRPTGSAVERIFGEVHRPF